MTQDYCKIEVCKLAKEKGFNENCDYQLLIAQLNPLTFKNPKNSDLPSYGVSQPTQDLLCKWLRSKQIYVTVYPFHVSTSNKTGIRYTWEVYTEGAEEVINDESALGFLKYEEAMEFALKIALSLLP